VSKPEDAGLDLLAAEVLRRAESRLASLLEQHRKPDRGLSAVEARKKLGISSTKWYEMRKAGELPEPNVAGTYSEKALDEVISGTWRPKGRRRVA
jgi:predicted DNA-binding transcriptional regulator AlpA